MNKLAGGLAAALERLEREAREYVADREQSSGANEALAVIDADHPFHAAVRAVEALCGGKLPSAAWSHWRLLLRTSRADDATPAEYEGAILAVEAIANWAAEVQRKGSGKQSEPPADPLLTHLELAKRFDTEAESARKRLDRWRQKNAAGDGWHEVTERRANEPQYLYRLSAVLSLFASS